MRVLYTYNFHRGGNGSLNATMATVRVMREAGHDVREFTRDSRDLPSSLGGRLTAAASAFYAPGAVREFGETLDEFRPDVVHAWDVFPLISPWVFRECTKRRIPVVMTSDDYFLTCPARNHFRDGQVCTKCLGGNEHWAAVHDCRANRAESLVVSAYSVMLRKTGLIADDVTRLVVSSEFTRDWMAEHSGVDRSRIDLVTHFVEIPDEPVDPAEGSWVGFGGRFVAEKGIHVFLEAAEIAGIPFRLSKNEKFFTEIDLPPHADVVITKGREDLVDFYRGARVMVSPVIWFETFGLVGAETMAMGIPHVSSDIGAVPNLIEHGVDGFHFHTGDARDLADKVRRLWDDPELCRRMGGAAREKAKRLWSAEAHVRGLEETYRKAMADVEA